MKRLKVLAITVLLFISQQAQAQESSVGNWMIYFGNQPFAERWNWHHEVQYRNYNIAGDLEQLLLRTGIGYNLSPQNNNLLIGYGFIRSRPYDSETGEKFTVNEHRLYQQFITRQQFGPVYLQHRYRLEERFIESDFAIRFRYFLAMNLPLNKKLMEPGAVYGSLYNEIFFNNRQNYFDRNRLYGAIGYVFSQKIRAETGVMRQSVNSGGRTQLQFVVFVSDYR